MPHITPEQSIGLAQTEATTVWDGNTAAVYNAGAPDDRYLYADELDAV
jgi:hypothetical protein